MLEQLTRFTTAITAHAADYLVTFAAIGAITMAILQVVKELTPVRSWFQRRMFLKWLSRCAPSTQEGAIPTAFAANLDLIGLATGGDSDALFSLEIERLAGQITAAATLVIDFPPKHVAALKCLACQADPKDIDALILVDEEGRTRLEAARDNGEQRHEYHAFIDSKTRVSHYIQRNIDGFQISTGFRWKWLLQIASLTISYVVTMIGLAIFATPASGLDAWWNAAKLVPFALAAGFLAPIARDLLTTITQLARR